MIVRLYGNGKVGLTLGGLGKFKIDGFGKGPSGDEVESELEIGELFSLASAARKSRGAEGEARPSHYRSYGRQLFVAQQAAVHPLITWQFTILFVPLLPAQVLTGSLPSMKSSPPLPSIVSTPGPPQTKSFPSPAVIVSFPAPPEMKSFPSRPSIMSSPPRPRMQSLPAVPTRLSEWFVPIMMCDPVGQQDESSARMAVTF